MPSLADNLHSWDDPSNWVDGGNEWSHSWGSTATMWHGSILPRIAANLPAGRLLEIACGHGRVTAHLLGHCTSYVGIDLAPTCIATCRQRFAAATNATFLVGDGTSLAGIDDGSIDFVFSWDSLVHAELEAVGGYVRELARVLRPGGTAFLHHSNLAEFVDVGGRLTVENPHWRASSVSATVVRAVAAQHGVQTVAQEELQWGSPVWNDCFSLLRRPIVPGTTVVPRLFRHPGFAEELGFFRVVDETYRQSLRG